MKILGHIHSFNDEEVIDRSLAALLGQTYALDEILIVDNASTDGTLRRSFPDKVTVIRHLENRGTSGAVITGFEYALKKQYDWIWVFDADSAPHKHALEKLMELYHGFPSELQEQILVLAAHASGGIFTRTGIKGVQPKPDQLFCECDACLWTGSLFNLAAVQKVGLPSPDYVLDMGEVAYGYQGKRCGYKTLVYQGNMMDHDLGGPAMRFRTRRFGPFSFTAVELPPIRCYYIVRNTIYFWLYEYQNLNFVTALYSILRQLSVFTGKNIINFLLIFTSFLNVSKPLGVSLKTLILDS